MSATRVYQIPDEFFFRLHHVRPRFKNNVEEVLLYMATSIGDLGVRPKVEFNKELNSIIRRFKQNATSAEKTIDNWRTEISALFALIVGEDFLEPAQMAIRLANNQYLDEFFNYFLYSFQYPGGHNKARKTEEQLIKGIKFKPCQFILELLTEGERLTGRSFSITAEELTQCAYFDLRVTAGGRGAKEVAQLIIQHRAEKMLYNHQYHQMVKGSGDFPSTGDVYRYAGDILDYMVLANLLSHKGSGFYYELNHKNQDAIDCHLNNQQWFDGYGESQWFEYVNHFGNIDAFKPRVDKVEIENINQIVQGYYERLTGGAKITSKLIGDYGEYLILVHEYLRTHGLSNRQHLINQIPTPLGVGYDIQSIEIEKNKRYIEVKTTRSKKAINNNRFKLTPNEWDTAETIGECYFIYYLVVNDVERKICVIQNPVQKVKDGLLKIDENLVIEFNRKSGTWLKLLETNI